MATLPTPEGFKWLPETPEERVFVEALQRLCNEHGVVAFVMGYLQKQEKDDPRPFPKMRLRVITADKYEEPEGPSKEFQYRMEDTLAGLYNQWFQMRGICR